MRGDLKGSVPSFQPGKGMDDCTTLQGGRSLWGRLVCPGKIILGYRLRYFFRQSLAVRTVAHTKPSKTRNPTPPTVG